MDREIEERDVENALAKKSSSDSDYVKDINRRMLAGEPLYHKDKRFFIKYHNNTYFFSIDGILWAKMASTFIDATRLEKVYE